MYYSIEHRMVYLATPRTGSNSVAEMLQRQFGFESISAHHCTLAQGVAGAQLNIKAMRFAAGGSNRPVTLRTRPAEIAADMSGWIIWTTVRNHFDSLVSWFCRNDERAQLNIEWIGRQLSENPQYHRPGQLYWMHPRSCSHITRFETLEEDTARILEMRGLTMSHTLPRKNTSAFRAQRDYRSFYDRETRRFVEWLYAEEMAIYGYRFE